MMLSETEAAKILGVTKELLYSFVKTGINEKKLKTYESENNNFFYKEDLIEWDEFLSKPWSKISTTKPPIPASIKEYLKVESGGKCCRCGSGHRLDNAHIKAWSESLSHHPHNLIRLCTDCHTKYDDGIISFEEIKNLKQTKIKQIINNLESLLDEFFNNIESFIPTGEFIGRKKEIEDLRNLLKKNRLVMICGVGGIGKTHLLKEVIRTEKYLNTWIDLDKYNNAEDLLMKLYDLFKATSRDEFIQKLDLQGNILILDSFEVFYNIDSNASKLIKFIISKTSRVTIVFTSQIDFRTPGDEIEILKIDKGLSVKEADSLITRLIFNKNLNYDFLLKLISFSEGHPLSIYLIAGLLNVVDDSEKVWESIESVGTKYLKDPKEKKHDRTTSLEICLSSSFEALNENDRWLLKYLSNFVNGCKIINIESILQNKNSKFKNESELHLSLGTLQLSNFIQLETDFLEFRRTKILRPVRTFIIDKAFSQSKYEAHQIRLKAYNDIMMETMVMYSNGLFSENIQFTILRYELEMPNFMRAFRNSVHTAYCKKCTQFCNKEDYLEIITGISFGVYKFLFTRGHFKQGLYINDEGAKAHFELEEYDFAIDDLAQAAMLNHRMSNTTEVKRYLKKILECEEKVGRKFAVTCLIEGELMRKNNPLNAIKKFEEGLKICKEDEIKLGTLPPSLKKTCSSNGNRAGFYGEIGRTYEHNLNAPEDALAYHLKAYEIQKEMKDFTNMNCTCHHIANCYDGINDNDLAIKYYREALEGFIEYGQSQYISNSFSQLGRMKMKYPSFNMCFIKQYHIEASLKDIEKEMKEYLRIHAKKDFDLGGGLNQELVFKLFNCIKLASFYGDGKFIYKWAKKLKHEFPRTAPYPNTFLSIAEIVGHVISKGKITEDQIRDLHIYCFLRGTSIEHAIMKPFTWLAKWLYVKNIIPETSALTLYNQTKNYLEENNMITADDYVD